MHSCVFGKSQTTTNKIPDRNRKVWSITLGHWIPLNPIIDFRIDTAPWKVSARKNTQENTTQRKVRRWESLLQKNALGECCASVDVFFAWNKWLMLRKRPCNPPQKTKFQLAPCQNPPKSMVSIRFIWRRCLPLRLPPSGIYKYSRKKRDNVICQRRQKSMMFTAL